jgi:hypothetical protein
MSSLHWRYLDDRGVPHGPVSEDTLVRLIEAGHLRGSVFIRPVNRETKHFISTRAILRLAERLAVPKDVPLNPPLTQEVLEPRAIPEHVARALTVARWMRFVRAVLILVGVATVAGQLSPVLGDTLSALLAVAVLVAVYAFSHNEDTVRARALAYEHPELLTR